MQLESEQTQAELPPLTEPEQRPSRRSSVGQLLRETRESQGSDLNRVATALRIRAAYLEAIEEGRYDNLPGAVYALGFVRTYAVHLGLDGEEAVRRFKLEAEGFDGQRDLTFPVPLGERSIPGATLVLAAIILAICGYGVFYYLSSSARPRPEHVSAVPRELALPRAVVTVPPPATSEPSPSEAASSTPTPAAPPAGALVPPSMNQTAPSVETAAPTPATVPPGSPTAAPEASPPVAAVVPPAPAAAPLVASAPPPAPASVSPAAPAESAPAPVPERTHVYGLANGKTRIVIHAVADSWIQVHDKDNVAIFTRELHAGDVYHVPDQPGLSMRTGLASGLAITVDGRSTPPLSGGTRSNILLDPDRLLAGTAVVRSAAVRVPASTPVVAPVSASVPAEEPATDLSSEPAANRPQ